jgi:hypothetical protein
LFVFVRLIFEGVKCEVKILCLGVCVKHIEIYSQKRAGLEPESALFARLGTSAGFGVLFGYLRHKHVKGVHACGVSRLFVDRVEART